MQAARETSVDGHELLLVDDHTIFRAGLIRLLQHESDLRVVAEAATAADALELLEQRRFDAVLLDINLPVRSGLDLLRTMQRRWPELPVVVLSMYPARQYAVRAFEAGARGYVSKDMDAQELVMSVRRVANGGRYITGEVAGELIGAGRESSEDLHLDLSPREFEVLVALARGDRVTDIADAGHLSVKTVSTYRSRLLAKLGLSSTADLVRYAIDHGLVD